MRKVLWMVLVVGALLVAAPFAMSLPARADGGQDMMDDFRPLMQQENVDTTARYYNDVFVPLGGVVPAMSEENMAKFQGYLEGIDGMGADAQNLIPGLAQAMGMTTDQVQAFVAANYPAMAQMLANLPQMQQDFGDLLGLMSANVGVFSQVPAGLDHYEPLVSTMEANVGNYEDIDGLPNFRLFTWFFVIPGVVLVALAGFGLFQSRPRTTTATAAGGVRLPVHSTPAQP